MHRILLIESNAGFTSCIADRLALSQYDVRVEADEPAGLGALDEWAPALVIVDPAQRTPSGEYLIRAIRNRAPNVSLLAVGTENSETAAVLALRTGADDYHPAPVRMLEFLARADALLRRPHPGSHAPPPQRIEIRGVTVDRSARQVSKLGRLIPVAPREFDLLEVLFVRAGWAVSRAELLKVLGGNIQSAHTRAVDQHVLQIRRKLAAVPPCDPLIDTVRGVGYCVSPE